MCHDAIEVFSASGDRRSLIMSALFPVYGMRVLSVSVYVYACACVGEWREEINNKTDLRLGVL